MPEAEDFINGNAFALLVGCQFDKGRLTWKAWRAPYLIATTMGLTSDFAPGRVSLGRQRAR